MIYLKVKNFGRHIDPELFGSNMENKTQGCFTLKPPTEEKPTESI